MFRRKPCIRRNTYKGRPGNRRTAVLSGLRLTLRLALITGAFALFNLTLILGYDWITQTDRLGIQAITVTGCRRLTPAMVENQAGLATARNILAVNLSVTRKRLLAHPWIAEARVTRHIPDRLHIDIREHTCLAVLDLGRRFLLSDQGQVFMELAPGDLPDVPLVTGLTYADLGLHTENPTQVMRSVLNVLKPRARGQFPVMERIREVNVDPSLGLTVFLADDGQPRLYRTVMLGFDGFEEKYEALRNIDAYLLKNFRYAGVKSIDLKNLNRIIVHPMETGATEDARKEV